MIDNIAPFKAMSVLKKATRMKAEGKPVISLAVGQPSARLPGALRELIEQEGRQGQFGYTDALGINKLQKRLSQYHNNKYGDAIEPEQIAVTSGASGAFSLAFLACFKPGDRIAIAVPGYPAYRNIIRALGFEPVEIRVDAATRWCLNAELIRECHKTTPLAGVLVASPANPTGTMLSAQALREAVEFCEECGIRFISDEIYHGLSYGSKDITARDMGPNVIVINSFSKYFCMTGWRVGWMVLPSDLVDPVERLAQNIFICPPDISQRLAFLALEHIEDFEAIKTSYTNNRAHLLSTLPALGFDNMLPVDGAFYAYFPVTGFAKDSAIFAERMLDEIHVAMTPGIDFDLQQGHKMMRISFAGSSDDLIEATSRLQNWLPTLATG